MKKKNFIVVCAAAGICLVCVIVLAGGMGIYAGKAGTTEFEPVFLSGTADDVLTSVLEESTGTEEALAENLSKEGDNLQEKTPKEKNNMTETGAPAGSDKSETDVQVKEQKESGEKDTGTAAAVIGASKEVQRKSDAQLQEIWDKLYAEYTISKHYVQYAPEEERAGESSDQEGIIVSLDQAKLGVQDAGLILLREINRLFPSDELESLSVMRMRMICSMGDEGAGYIRWEGYLENSYQQSEENYLSYSFEIDAVTGKVLEIGRFRPYRKDIDYSLISWTDEEILEQAGALIKKYDLAKEEELDWQNAIVMNATNGAAALQNEDSEPDTSVCLENVVTFTEEGRNKFYLGMDFETGEFRTYMWQ